MSANPDPTAHKIHFGDDIKPAKATGYSINRRLSLSEKCDDIEADQKKTADEDRNRKKKQASPIPSTKTSVTKNYAFLATGPLLLAFFSIAEFSTTDNLATDHCIDFFRVVSSMACIPVHWCHLWRHWDQSSLRLFIDVL
jgi:hypothetical protein